MTETNQALQKKSAEELAEEQFERRYEFLTNQTVTALRELSRSPGGWQNLLAPCGIGLMLLAFVFKAFGAFGHQFLATLEFCLVFLVGTLLLILGSYFRTKFFQEGSKAVQRTTENFVKRFEAHTGPLNPPAKKENEDNRSSPSTGGS
jgi:hypothetical protein